VDDAQEQEAHLFSFRGKQNEQKEDAAEEMKQPLIKL